MTKHPLVKSPRQHIRLWFEFYKMALNEPALTKEIRRSRAFYAPWGDVSVVSFTKWWKEKSSLFGETRVVEVSKITKYESVIYVSVPLNQAVTAILSQIKRIIEQRQGERRQQRGVTSTKTKKGGFGRYHLTPGVEFRGKPVNEALIIYRDIYMRMGKPPINSAFASAVFQFFDKRPRSNWTPYILATPPEPDRRGIIQYTESQLRSLRRYVKRAESLMLAAAKGDFPGRSYMK